MKTTINYEWTIETTDENGDVVASDFSDTFDAFVHVDADQRVALVRTAGNEEVGVTARQWAYVECGRLPAKFDGGASIPGRFQSEIDRAFRIVLRA